MDPASLGSSQWDEIGRMLGSLWIVVLLVVLSAANFLLGHNVIASLVATNHLPSTCQKARPLFYAIGAASFAVALFYLCKVVDFAGVMRDFWPSYWI